MTSTSTSSQETNGEKSQIKQIIEEQKNDEEWCTEKIKTDEDEYVANAYNIGSVTSLTILLYGMLSFIAMMYDEIIPLFFMATISEVPTYLESREIIYRLTII